MGGQNCQNSHSILKMSSVYATVSLKFDNYLIQKHIKSMLSHPIFNTEKFLSDCSKGFGKNTKKVNMVNLVKKICKNEVSTLKYLLFENACQSVFWKNRQHPSNQSINCACAISTCARPNQISGFVNGLTPLNQGQFDTRQ